jgi:hypothetical protein
LTEPEQAQVIDAFRSAVTRRGTRAASSAKGQGVAAR